MNDYATIFPAKLTSSSEVSGVYQYAWTEQQYDPSTGAFVAATSPRTGTTTAQYATEINNTNVATPCFAWLRFKAVIGGTQTFEFDAGQIADGSGIIIEADGSGSAVDLINFVSGPILWTFAPISGTDGATMTSTFDSYESSTSVGGYVSASSTYSNVWGITCTLPAPGAYYLFFKFPCAVTAGSTSPAFFYGLIQDDTNSVQIYQFAAITTPDPAVAGTTYTENVNAVCRYSYSAAGTAAISAYGRYDGSASSSYFFTDYFVSSIGYLRFQ